MIGVRRLSVATAITFALGLLASYVVRLGPVAEVDRDLTRWLHERTLESDAVAGSALDVTTIGDPITLTVLVVLTVGWLLVHGHRRIGFWLVVVTALASIVNSVLKIVVARSRPDFDSVFLEPLSKSFPSGHALNTTVVLGAMTVALVAAATSRRALVVPLAATVAAGVALAVGITRPLLGVHFVSDVVAGWVLGVIWLVLSRPASSAEVSPESAAPAA